MPGTSRMPISIRSSGGVKARSSGIPLGLINLDL